MAKPNSKAPLGQGGRFEALKEKLEKRGGIKSPSGLAAVLGRKRYGAKAMSKMASKGRMGK